MRMWRKGSWNFLYQLNMWVLNTNKNDNGGIKERSNSDNTQSTRTQDQCMRWRWILDALIKEYNSRIQYESLSWLIK